MRSIASLAAAVALAPSMAMADPVSARSSAPKGVLEAPAYLGLPVLEVRRSVDGQGRRTSVTVLETALDGLYDRLRELFAGSAPFAPGWRVVGAGRSRKHGVVQATLKGPRGRRWALSATMGGEGWVHLKATDRPAHDIQPRIAPVAPDRRPGEVSSSPPPAGATP